MLKQVLKHLKTLRKYLHDQVTTTQDPNVIESTNRQIRSIEKLENEVKSSMKAQQKRGGKPGRPSISAAAADALFSMSVASESGEPNSISSRLSVASKKAEKLAIVSRESVRGQGVQNGD